MLVTCKYGEDLFKNEGARVLKDVSHYKSGNFSNALGQLATQSVESSRISNSSEILWFPACMKKIRSKKKALEWQQVYMTIFQTLKGR